MDGAVPLPNEASATPAPGDAEAVGSGARPRFPGLVAGTVRCDGPAGSQPVDVAIAAIDDYLRSPVANAHGGFPASDATDEIVSTTRISVGRLFGCQPGHVVFGPSMTSLTFRLTAAVAETLRPGDEVVVTRLEHEGNVAPWLDAVRRAKAVVRFVEPDRETLDLPREAVSRLVTTRTRWIAVTAASNAVGTITDIPGIVALARDAGARVFVDAVHAAPHVPVSLAAWQCDCLVTSAYKWYGPHLAALCLSDELALALAPPRIRGISAIAPESWERGALPFELLPGMRAAAEYLREVGWERIQGWEGALCRQLLAGLSGIRGVRVYGAPGRRTATALFNVLGLEPERVARALAERGVFVWHGHFLALELMRLLGIEGAVRVGFMHYSTPEDVDRLLQALTDVVESGRRTIHPVQGQDKRFATRPDAAVITEEEAR